MKAPRYQNYKEGKEGTIGAGMVPNSQKDAEWTGKRRTTMRTPSSQEDISGKYLTDQSQENRVTMRAPSLQDIQLGTGQVMKAASSQ